MNKYIVTLDTGPVEVEAETEFQAFLKQFTEGKVVISIDPKDHTMQQEGPV